MKTHPSLEIDIICKTITGFLSDSYLFIAPVSKAMYYSIDGYPRTTRSFLSYFTPAQFKEALDNGLEREGLCSDLIVLRKYKLLYMARYRGCQWDTDSFNLAVSRAPLSVLEWMVKDDCPVNEYVFCGASSRGSIEILDWLLEQGFPFNEAAGVSAIRCGQIHVIVWMNENELIIPAESTLCSMAASFGQFRILEFLHSNNYHWDEDTCSFAASYGHLDILKWLRRNGAPWDEDTCSFAASGGHLETLKWARDNGCPWGQYTLFYAEEGGHMELATWARENGCPVF